MTPDLPPPFNSDIFRFVIGVIFGSVIGSFTTMLVYRLPRGLSVIAPRSHCPTCKTTLGVRDLVPLLSWLLAKGKCRHCQAPIGSRYLLIEAAISLIFGLLAVFLPRFL